MTNEEHPIDKHLMCFLQGVRDAKRCVPIVRHPLPLEHGPACNDYFDGRLRGVALRKETCFDVPTAGFAQACVEAFRA